MSGSQMLAEDAEWQRSGRKADTAGSTDCLSSCFSDPERKSRIWVMLCNCWAAMIALIARPSRADNCYLSLRHLQQSALKWHQAITHEISAAFCFLAAFHHSAPSFMLAGEHNSSAPGCDGSARSHCLCCAMSEKRLPVSAKIAGSPVTRGSHHQGILQAPLRRLQREISIQQHCNIKIDTKRPLSRSNLEIDLPSIMLHASAGDWRPSNPAMCQLRHHNRCGYDGCAQQQC
ncbi:hypothetical protein [Brucella pituitosa]|uniref:hypothetical protein n=1 Tax=Brucella pituitosa TaxID=571256 RepID=UPI00126012C9|nr:hypothetical protein [Brucella pituitosa]